MQKIIYSESFLEFLKTSSSKVANVLYRLHNKRYVPICINDSEINYLTFRKDNTISYLPNGKELILTDDGKWAKEGRQNGKPSKVIRKLFSPRFLKLFKDSDFETFTNDYKSVFSDGDYTFKILDNLSINDVYNMRMKEGEGSLNNSCMRNKNYFEIYTSCKDLRIITLTNNEGLLCGRCLLWNLGENITFMDRFYVTEDFLYQKFIHFAKENNFWYKRNYKSYDNKTEFIMPCGKDTTRYFTIDTNTDCDYYPYIDTFHYGSDGVLSNNEENCDYTYSDTSGERENNEENHEDESYDDINGEWISQYDAVYIEYGERCYRYRTTHIDNCVMVNDSYYHENDCNIVEVGNDYYTKDSDDICQLSNGDYELIDDCVYCERDSEYYLSDDCVYCEKENEFLLRDEAVEINDNWYHIDSELITKIEGDYYLIDSEEIELKEGKYYLIEVIN